MTASSIFPMNRHVLSRYILTLVGIILLGNLLPAQTGTPETEGNSPEVKESTESEKERPNQFNIFKVNIGQFAINEARLLYEIQIGPASSIEVGAGYIYPNPFWFERSTEAVLATGFGVYGAYRKYRILNRYFSTPAFRPYFSPTAFYRYSSYENEWLLFEGPSVELSECARFSQTFHQIGTSIRFGGQTTQGRLVVDMYTGLGLKFIVSDLTQNAINRESDVCVVNSETELTVYQEHIFDTNILIQAGVKLGIRHGNRDQKFKNKRNKPDPTESTPPPTYRP